MELVNPNSSYTWTEPLDIHGVPMMGVFQKQGTLFVRHAWLAAREDSSINADALGNAIRNQWRPLSRPTREAALGMYARRDVPAMPKYFIVETVATCSRRCPFCTINVMKRYGPDGQLAKPGRLEWRGFMKLMQELGPTEPYGLSAYQLGEPLNYVGHDEEGKKKDIGDLVDAAKRIGNFRVVNVSTHGDVTNLHRLLECDVDDLIVSIDGTTAETYRKNRPMANGKDEGSFERTVGRVKEFLALKARRGISRPWVMMQVINSELTRDEVLPFIREWIVVDGVDSVYIKNLDSMRSWLGDKMVSDEEDMIKAARVENMPCQHLWGIGSMVFTGQFNACAHDAYTELVDGKTIYNSTFAEWWHGDFLTDLRRQHSSGTFRMPCRECRERDPWL